MTKLEQYLFEYIEDERLPALQSDGEFLLAQKLRNAAEEKLTSGLTKDQLHLFSRYSDAENLISSIQLRYVFQEALTIVHDILNLSL